VEHADALFPADYLGQLEGVLAGGEVSA